MSQMAMRPAYLLLLSLIVGNAAGQKLPLKNVPFDKRENPFLEVLLLDRHRISLTRDSTRVMLSDGGTIDLILHDKCLWRVRRYDEDGREVDSGDLVEGNGRVRLRVGKNIREAHFNEGKLNGVSHFATSDGDTTDVWTFAAGWLHGESRSYSFWDRRYVAHRYEFEAGVLVKSEGYGKMNPWWGFFPFLKRISDPYFLCSQTIYSEGKVISNICFVKKCRRCGM